MARTTLFAILFSVLLSAGAQIVLKAGVSAPGVQAALSGGRLVGVLVAFAGSPLVWLGLLAYATGALVWLFVLARVDVSLAYPFLSVGFIITTLLAWLIYGEDVTGSRLLGTALIAGGVFVLAQS